jgi:TolB protein
MKRFYQLSALTLTLCGFFILTSCGGSSTGPDNGGDNDTDEPPAAPANLTGNSGDQEVILNWDANNEDDLRGYHLYRSTESFSEISNMEPVNGSDVIQETEFNDTNLDNGTTYYYRLTAVDEGSNESDVSAELEITPFSDPPDRP